jgi:hypothetical protein
VVQLGRVAVLGRKRRVPRHALPSDGGAVASLINNSGISPVRYQRRTDVVLEGIDARGIGEVGEVAGLVLWGLNAASIIVVHLKHGLEARHGKTI